jgi:methyltransferase
VSVLSLPPTAAIAACVFVGVFIPMIVEAARARRNEAVQRARGGIEPAGDVFAAMRIAYPAVFVAMIAEQVLRGTPSAPAAAAVGALVFCAAKIIKWWAIRSLGSFWTFRVIVVPGARLVTSGPYRYVRHPNYVAVCGEIIGAALITRAVISGPIGFLLFGLLMWRRIGVENVALAEMGQRSA